MNVDLHKIKELSGHKSDQKDMFYSVLPKYNRVSL